MYPKKWRIEISGFAVSGHKTISDVIQGSPFTLIMATNCARYWKYF